MKGHRIVSEIAATEGFNVESQVWRLRISESMMCARQATLLTEARFQQARFRPVSG